MKDEYAVFLLTFGLWTWVLKYIHIYPLGTLSLNLRADMTSIIFGTQPLQSNFSVVMLFLVGILYRVKSEFLKFAYAHFVLEQM